MAAYLLHMAASKVQPADNGLPERAGTGHIAEPPFVPVPWEHTLQPAARMPGSPESAAQSCQAYVSTHPQKKETAPNGPAAFPFSER